MATQPESVQQFSVRLDNFDGPFDLLLSLISKHKLDITEVALAKVTDEFISYLKALEDSDAGWELGQASEFLVVAATLLDLKAARLLPVGEVENQEDLEYLEARDLLFARLLQYRAYKELAGIFGAELRSQQRRAPRRVTLEPQFASLLPDLVWSIGPQELARIAAGVFSRPKAPTEVDISHLHAPAVSVREQAAIITNRLRRSGAMNFRNLVADAEGTHIVVGRFLALLELYREGAVAFDQVSPLGDLTIRWTGTQDGEVELSTDYDEGQTSP